MIRIFDLDGTVIDSGHRVTNTPSGDFCLASWRRNATPQNIARDSLLPLAQEWKAAHARGDIVGFCTSRQMKGADMLFLRANGLPWRFDMSRKPGDMTECGPYKVRHFQRFFRRNGFSPSDCVFYEDSPSVLRAVREAFPDMHVIDAKRLNMKLTA